MTTDQEIAAFTQSLEVPRVPEPPKPRSTIDELKETLESLKTINPALVDSSRIFEHLLTLVDAVAVARETNGKITTLTDSVVALQEINRQTVDAYNRMEKRVATLTEQISQNDVWLQDFKSKAFDALEALRQYMNTH